MLSSVKDARGVWVGYGEEKHPERRRKLTSLEKNWKSLMIYFEMKLKLELHKKEWYFVDDF